MKRSDAIPYVSFVVDDAGSGRELNSDPDAVIRAGSTKHASGCTKYPSVLVGWQCGFEPLFVAVHSYLDVQLDDDEAEEMARDYLTERGWFGCDGTHCSDDGCRHNTREADFIIR